MMNRSENWTSIGLLSPLEFSIVTFVLILCGLLGLLVNSVTLLLFIRVKVLRCPTNIFVMALSVCDLLMSVLGIPFAVVSSASNRWIFGRSGCLWYGFVMSFLGFTSIYLLTAISVERYLLITNPFSAPLITKKRAVAVAILCIGLAFMLSLFPLVGWSSYALEAALISCSVNWRSKLATDISYTVTVFLTCLVAPVGIMCFSYFKVFLTVRALASNPLWGEDSPVTKRNIKIEFRTTRNILLMIGAFLLAWTPYSVVSFWAAFGDKTEISPVAGTVPALIAKSSIAWNPLIYVLTNREFRKRIANVFPCLHCLFIRSDIRDGTKSDEQMDMNLIPTGKVDASIKNVNYLTVTPSIQNKNGRNSQYLNVSAEQTSVTAFHFDSSQSIAEL